SRRFMSRAFYLEGEVFAMTSLKSLFVVFTLVVLCLMCAPRALADAEGAKKALETLKKNIADDTTAGIDQDVKMVEFELKDTPDADKKPIQDELDGIKKKLFDAKVAKLKPGYKESIERQIQLAKEDLANNAPDNAVGD